MRALSTFLAAVLLTAFASAALAQGPSEATDLFVDSEDAQAGTQGDPVNDVDLTPVFSAVFNHPTGTETTTEVKFQVATDPAFNNRVWSQGWKNIASTAEGERCPDVAYSGQNLDTYTLYYWRVRFRDSSGNAGPWSTEGASFRTIGVPTEANTLHVDSTDSQGGTQGNPVNDIDLSPVFSAVFTHEDPTATTTEVKFQVATDAAFNNRVWSQGYKTIASTAHNTRCPDVPYTGQALDSFTVYYWRVRFKDANGEQGPWSTEAATFRTVGHTLLATDLHVDSDDAQSGTQGDPVTNIDLTPVFSAMFRHEDGAATTTEAKFQVATDAAFINRVWSQGWKTIASTTANNRSPDVAYSGQPLNYNTTYYWRVRFRDSNGDAGEWSTESASFSTIPFTLTTADELLQGTTQTVSISGTGLTNTTDVSFGANVTVNFWQVVNDSLVTANVTTDDLADAGDRVFTVTTTTETKVGEIRVVFPTDIIPTVTNAEPSRNPAIGGVNVFLTNGAFFKSETDIATRGRMMGISFSRVYRSDIALNGPLGQGWTGYYFQRAIYDGSSQDITWFTPDGRGEVFAWNGTDWDSPVGVYVEADRDSGTGVITLTDRHQFVCQFDSDGRLTACIDRNGNSTTCTYNADGQLEQITDDRGYFGKLSYYNHGRVEKYEDFVWDDSDPRVIEYVYDSAGNLVECKMQETDRYNDANGNRTTYGYAYDSEHRLTECTNPREFESGGSSYMQNTYDALGRVIEQRLGESGQNFYLRYTDDGMGSDLVREFDRRELLTNYTLDPEGRTTQVERKTGFWEPDLTAPIDHDAPPTSLSPKLRSGDPGQFITTFSYNANHEVTETVLPRGNSIEYTYDTSANHLANGNVLEVRRKDNALGSLADIVSTYTYEAQFQFVKTVTNPRGFTTTNFYDYEESVGNAGNLVRVEYHDVTLGQPLQEIETSTTYNAFGQPVTMTDGEGNVTTYEYYASGDNEGFLHKRIVATGELDLTTEFEYDRVGNTIGVWSPRALEVGAVKDNFKTISTINELNQTTRTQGKVLFVGGSERTDTYFLYDLNGNQTNRFREYVTFDGNQPAAPSDPNDPASFTKSASAMAATWVESSATYNLLNYIVTSEVDAIAAATITRYTTAYEYDDSYNRTATVTPLGFRHETVYDERNLTFQSIRAAGSGAEGTYESDYDLNGNVKESRDALSNASVFEYDGFDRQNKTTDAAGHFSTTTYDPNSNVVTTRSFNVGGTLLQESTRLYDELDRQFETQVLAEKADGTDIGDGLRTTTTLFDKNSRTVTTTDDNNVTSSYEYDGANRVTKTTDNVGNFQVPTYNLDSVVIETTFHEINDITGVDEISHESRDLDYLNRTLVSYDQRYEMGVRETDVEFKYDGWSRTVQRLDAANTETSHEYDLLSRTTRVTERPTVSNGEWIIKDFVYDDDSRTLQRLIYNEPDLFAQPQITSYTYDERNRRTGETRPDGDSWTFVYDAQSNLTQWTDPLGTVVDNDYEVRNLIERRDITRGTGIEGVTREDYVFDGLRRLTSANNFENRSGVDEPLTEQSWDYNTLSLPEVHTQKMWNREGQQLGPTAGYVTEARYDAIGLNTEVIYSDGRKLVNAFDARNRLDSTTDDGTGTVIASYQYSDSRLIQRVNGNGTVVNIGYESSGCGCGGFSSVVENVEHTGPFGHMLYQTERKYDVVRNVTVERRNHQGGYGEVHRYDDVYRLTDEYWGADLRGATFDTLADPSTTPTVYAFQRHYDLDTRGNRTKVTDTDSSGNILKVTDYSPDADTNVYNTVDGLTYAFDAIEQMTFDPSTGLYHAYNYKGQPVLTDDDPALDSAERRYVYDTNGRLRVEERWINTSPEPVDFTAHIYDCVCGPCGCDSNGAPIGQSDTFAPGATGTATSSIQRVMGLISDVTGSAMSDSPLSAAPLPTGRAAGDSIILENIDDGVNPLKWHYRHHDQLGSLIGMTDDVANRVFEGWYGKYGEPYHKHVLYDGASHVISALPPGGPHPSSVRIILNEDIDMLLDAPLDNAQTRVSWPDGMWTSFVVGTGNDGVNDFIDIDATGDFASALPLLESGAAILSVFDAFDATFGEGTTETHTAGVWTSVTYNSGPDTTTLTHDDGDPGSDLIASYMEGWFVQLNADLPVVRTVLSVGVDSVTVSGNATSIAGAGDAYCIMHPPGVDVTTGATQTDPCVKESRYLWAHGLYYAPVVGFYMLHEGVLDIHGAQPGSNLSGQYYFWNRVLHVRIGRWTTADPTQYSWANGRGYVGNNPLSRYDPTGLKEFEQEEVGSGKVDGKTYKSKEYGDAESCGDFRIDVRTAPATLGRGPTSVVKVHYIPSDPIGPWCPCCTDIKLIQFVRTVHDGNPVAHGELGTIAYQEIKSGNKDRKARGNKMVKHAGNEGWGVDLHPEAYEGDEVPVPWYGEAKGHNDKSGRNMPAKLPWRGNEPFKEDAWIRDTPRLPLGARDGSYSYEFRTCAICDDGTESYSQMTVFGCIDWKFTMDEELAKGRDTRQRVTVTGTSKTYSDAQGSSLGTYE